MRPRQKGTGMIIKKDYSLCENLNNIQLRIIDYGHATAGGEWVGNIVTPPYARLYYIIGGDPYITITSSGKHAKTLSLEPGKCYLMPTGFSFRYACESSMEQIYFHINLTDYNGSDLLRCCKNMMEYTPPANIKDKLISLMNTDDLYSGLLLRQELYSSVLRMIGDNHVALTSSTYSRCVLLAIDYIRSHLSLKLGVKEIAANSFVSESTLAKKFKSEVGMTIGNYIDETILFESEQLLTKSELTVLQISEKFGFCDQFYFSRRFKAKYGDTPQKYRRQRPI